MSKLVETRQAYNQFAQLLDQLIRQRSGQTRELQRFREVLDVAFYLLGWSQFEYLVRKEFEDQLDKYAATKLVEGQAWRYMRDKSKSVSVRKRLDVLFHEKPTVRSRLDKDYSMRNDAAHDYKKLPKEARDIDSWLSTIQEIIDDARK